MQRYFTTVLSRGRRTRGAILLDVMGAMLIIGLGISATVYLMASDTSANTTTSQIRAAVILAANVHEYAISLDGGELPANPPQAVKYLLQLDGKTYTTPIDGAGNVIADMDGWSQQIAVTGVEVANLTGAPAAASGSTLRRLEVTVMYRERNVLTAQWLIARPSSDS